MSTPKNTLKYFTYSKNSASKNPKNKPKKNIKFVIQTIKVIKK